MANKHIKENEGFKMPFDNSFILQETYLPLDEHLETDGTVLTRAFNPLVDNPPWDLPAYKQEADVFLHFKDNIQPSKCKYDNIRVSQNFQSFVECTLNADSSPYKADMDMAVGDSYCEDFSEMKYYEKKPTCFMILGKETISSRLAKKISDYWGCVCIDVELVLKEHLKTNDLVSMHLNTTLKSGKVLRNAHIQSLLEQRVSAADVQHRGYVLCGLPFIPVAEDDPTAQNQMCDIFDWELRPNVIIYLACPDADVVNFRRQIRYDLFDSGNDIDMSLLGIGKRMQRVYANKKEGKVDEKEELYEDNYYEVEEEKVKLEATTERYLVTRIRDVPTYVEAELALYQKHILPVVEYYILKHNPQFVIKLDGRASANHSFLVLKEKLEVLPIQRVYLVERLTGASANTNASPAENFLGEGTRNEGDEFTEGQTPQDVYDELSVKNITGSRFRWRWSHWGSKCPVALTDGHCVDGNPNYSVSFMDKIFFLSDEAASNRFIMNPRKFLRRPKPELGCKICIVGPKFVGKSTLAHFLAAVFHGKVLSWQQLKETRIVEKHQAYVTEERDRLVAEAIEELREVKKMEYEQAVESQPRKLGAWREEIKSVLHQYVDSFRPSPEFYEKLHGSEEKAEITLPETPVKYTVSQMQDILEKYDIPAWDDPQYAEMLLDSIDELMTYCPNELLDPIPELEEVKDDDPEVVAAIDKKLNKTPPSSYELTPEEMAAILVKSIEETEGSRFYSSRGKKRHGGWVIDDFPMDNGIWEILETAGLIPDQMFCLKDSDVNQTNLLKRWIKRGVDSSPETYTSDLKTIMENMSPGFDNHDILTPMMQSSYNFSRCAGNSTVTTSLGGSEDHVPWPKGSFDTNIPPITVFQTSADTEETDVADTQSETQTQMPDLDFSLEEAVREHPSLENYNEVLNTYKTDWENIKLQIESKTMIVELIVTNKTIIQLLYEAAIKTMSLLRKAPHTMTEQEKSDEIEYQIREQQGSTVVEDYSEEVGSGDMKDTRRYGDTSIYCPVAFRLNRVLWAGQTDFACMFHDKIYNLSSEKAMEMFLEHPLEFAPFANPPKGIPPLRICVVGVICSGKSTICPILAKRLGVYFCDYMQSIEDNFMPYKKKVGRKHESSPETLVDLSYEGDEERLNVIRKYLMTGSSMPEADMALAIGPYWNHEPYKSEGIIVDGFPFRTPDVGFMKKYYFIPDIIIEVEVSMKTVMERASTKHIELWEARQVEHMKQQDEEERLMIEQWETEKKARYDELMIELRRGSRPRNHTASESEESQGPKKNIFGPSERTPEGQQLRKEQEEARRKSVEEEQREIEQTEARRRSIMMQLNEEEVQDWIQSEINEMIGIEFPEQPVLERDIEEKEDAEERIQDEIEAWFEQDTEDLEIIKASLMDENIPWETVNGEGDVESIVHNIAYIVDKFKYRRKLGVLERVYDIAQKEAEQLIHHGYYMLSKFGRWCPVQIAKKDNPIQMYIPNASKEKCIPVLHRRYIYYLANEENRKLFGEDPLYYLNQEPHVPIIPVRVGIVGPPKCGKTTLAERLAKEFSVRVTSIGSAIRQVMFLFPGSELAQNIAKHKEDGTRIPEKLKIQAVECEMLANKSLVQGVVFDGFPHSSEQILELSLIGSIPTVIIHLEGNLENTVDGLRSLVAGTEYYSRDPVIPEDMVREKYNNWERVHKPFVEFVSHEYQNVANIPTGRCKWWVYKHALAEIYDNLWEIKNYLRLVNEGVPISLRAMGITSDEFSSRQSAYRHYCAVCLKDNLLNSGRFPPKCAGLIQFRWYYYWVCPQHYDNFMASPELYVPPLSKARLPDSLPIPLGEFDQVDAGLFCMDGLCVVHYHDSPGVVVSRESGLWYLMVLYDGKIYHFCNQICQKKFMEEPERYSQVEINYREEPHSLKALTQLPNLGYMEQTLSSALLAAALSVESIRPKYPCLDLAKSGAVYVGTYLKTMNPLLGVETIKEYRKCMRRLEEQSKRVLDIAKRWQSHVNPFIQPFQQDEVSRSWVTQRNANGSDRNEN